MGQALGSGPHNLRPEPTSQILERLSGYCAAINTIA
jgi:hypothetical protein